MRYHSIVEIQRSKKNGLYDSRQEESEIINNFNQNTITWKSAIKSVGIPYSFFYIFQKLRIIDNNSDDNLHPFLFDKSIPLEYNHGGKAIINDIMQ